MAAPLGATPQVNQPATSETVVQLLQVIKEVIEEM